MSVNNKVYSWHLKAYLFFIELNFLWRVFDKAYKNADAVLLSPKQELRFLYYIMIGIRHELLQTLIRENHLNWSDVVSHLDAR